MYVAREHVHPLLIKQARQVRPERQKDDKAAEKLILFPFRLNSDPYNRTGRV